jgi:hypothetical protein
MTITLSGQIRSGDINAEFGRVFSSYMSMWDARNGRYGSINRQSARNPLNGVSKTNSGYAFSDWYGYNHAARQASIGLKQAERRVDADTRAWEFRYDGTALGQNWQWGTTSIRDWFYVPIGNRVDVYFDNNISWGGSWQEATRQIYSNQRGYLLNVRERASTYRNYSGVYVQSSERITIFNNS